MEIPGTAQIDLKVERIIGLAILVIAPVIYLVVGQILPKNDLAPKGVDDMVVYILLVVAAIEPAFYFVLERIQIAQFRKGTDSKMNPRQLFRSLCIIRMALSDVPFLLGFVVMLVTYDFNAMLYFYVAGIFWSIVHWPRASQYEKLIQALG